MAMVRMLRMNGPLGLRLAVLRRTDVAIVLMLDRMMNVFFRRMRRPGNSAKGPHGGGQKRYNSAVFAERTEHHGRTINFIFLTNH